LLLSAFVILVWFAIGAYWWLNSYGTLSQAVSHFWSTMRSDWMVLLFINDLVLLILIVCAWALKDASARQLGAARWFWAIFILALGSPALFIYLAIRPTRKSR